MQAQGRTRVKPHVTTHAMVASNLWVVQMWGEALDESFLRGFAGKLYTAVKVGSQGTQMFVLKGKEPSPTKALSKLVTWCALRLFRVQQNADIFGHSSLHLDMAGDWSAQSGREHVFGYPLITLCGYTTRTYNLKGSATPCQSKRPPQPQGNWSSLQSDPSVKAAQRHFKSTTCATLDAYKRCLLVRQL